MTQDKQEPKNPYKDSPWQDKRLDIVWREGYKASAAYCKPLLAALQQRVKELEEEARTSATEMFALKMTLTNRQARIAALESQLKPVSNKPKVICLCGSTRFKDAFFSEYARLSDTGNIVLTVSRLIPDHRDLKDWDFPEQEQVWHTLHFRKIDLADEVRVLNVGGYIGKSLKAEIEYATDLGKPITYLEALASQKGETK